MKRSGLSIRDPLEKFAEQMELVLRGKDAKKGERGWRGAPREKFHKMLKEEVRELGIAIANYEGTPGDVHLDEVIRECCDVANFAMFIADSLSRDRE